MLEGGSIAHLLKGEVGAVERPREELVFHFPHYQGDHPHTALFLGDHKLMRFYEGNERQLYNVKHDFLERTNIAGSHPEMHRPKSRSRRIR